jgi:hypothetical protein
MKGKKAVALGGSLLEKLRMARARGCGGRPWLPTAVRSDARARRKRRVARGAAVGGLNQRGKKEPRLRGTTWRGGWSRALARSCHMGRTAWGAGRRQGTRLVEVVSGQASAAQAGERGGARGPRVRA